MTYYTLNIKTTREMGRWSGRRDDGSFYENDTVTTKATLYRVDIKHLVGLNAHIRPQDVGRHINAVATKTSEASLGLVRYDDVVVKAIAALEGAAPALLFEKVAEVALTGECPDQKWVLSHYQNLRGTTSEVTVLGSEKEVLANARPSIKRKNFRTTLHMAGAGEPAESLPLEVIEAVEAITNGEFVGLSQKTEPSTHGLDLSGLAGLKF